MTFEEYLNGYFHSMRGSTLTSAMQYAIEGGKHFRPNLLFSVIKGFGMDEQDAYPAALALEMIHTYSLIHDDLPCMDNDDYRRGKPSVHKAFGEAAAVLAGDGLLTHAFGVIADSDYRDDIKADMISELSDLAGMGGMLYGQYLDISNNKEDLTEDLLQQIDDYKTGALFECALLFGMYLAEDEEHISFYQSLATLIGRAFQLQDDLFEVTKTPKEMGKSLSDKDNDKGTGVSFYGQTLLLTKINELFANIFEMLNTAPFNATELRQLLLNMKER